MFILHENSISSARFAHSLDFSETTLVPAPAHGFAGVPPVAKALKIDVSAQGGLETVIQQVVQAVAPSESVTWIT